MKAVIQRVNFSNLRIDAMEYSKISKGLLVFIGVQKQDDKKDIEYICRKITNLRIFEDENGKMNLSVKDIQGEIMIVSQFTLCADCTAGNRPSFIDAEVPQIAEGIYEDVVKVIKQMGVPVVTGKFGADMKINFENDGPVTILLQSK